MKNLISSILIFALAICWSEYAQTATAQGKVPIVPVTGGKKLKHSDKGNVAGVNQMPGLSTPKTISWETLTKEHFDFNRAIPKPRAQELTHVKGILRKRVVTTVDLPTVMKEYTQKTFSLEKYGADQEWVKSFGNIVNEFKKVKGNSKKTAHLLTQLQTKYSKIYEEISPYFFQLVRDDFLYSQKWDPYKDESVKGKQNDGILFVDHWYMQSDPNRHTVWNQNLGEHKVYQGAAILYTDVRSIKEMEKDYANYFSQVGQDYIEVYPVQDSYFTGVDPNGNEFLRMELYLRNDLPFPYESASYVMNILEHYDDGYFVSDYYSEDKNDLNWMAGRDTYLPIRTTRGELVGNMIVTALDFDIKRVPERDIDRIVSMKAGLGNMKRISEQRADSKTAAASK